MPILGTIGSSTRQGLSTAGSFYQIATTTLTATASTISFTSITNSYKHLQLRFYGQTTSAADDWVTLYFNNDTSANYDRPNARGENATATGGYTQSATFSYLTQLNASGQTNYFGSAVLTIPYYTNTAFERVAWSYGGFENGTGSNYAIFNTNYKSSNAITSIYLGFEGSGGFKIGTRASLYGIG